MIKCGENIQVGEGNPLLVIAGPCVIENEDIVMSIAEKALNITQKIGLPYIFKASFDKANRSSVDSFRGPGISKGLEILNKVKNTFKIPVLTDIHECSQIKPVAEVVDIIQIPAFLCRQTDLLVESAKTGLVVNVKKGQFISPYDMKNVVDKLESTGNKKIMLTERGTFFGYNNLVVDFRGLPVMRNFGYPVIFDATHSVQRPGGAGSSSTGDREFIAHLSRAAMAVGCDGVFLETHPNPEKALSDGPNMVALADLERLLTQLKNVHELVENNGFNK